MNLILPKIGDLLKVNHDIPMSSDMRLMICGYLGDRDDPNIPLPMISSGTELVITCVHIQRRYSPSDIDYLSFRIKLSNTALDSLVKYYFDNLRDKKINYYIEYINSGNSRYSLSIAEERLILLKDDKKLRSSLRGKIKNKTISYNIDEIMKWDVDIIRT
jgi:hypothetical protein